LRGFYDGDCRDDDLLIFSGGKLSSVQIIKEVLDDFVGLSGLKANPAKSSVFFFLAGLDNVQKKEILDFLEMQEGSLPVRHLVVPLITKSLPTMDCDCLIT